MIKRNVSVQRKINKRLKDIKRAISSRAYGQKNDLIVAQQNKLVTQGKDL